MRLTPADFTKRAAIDYEFFAKKCLKVRAKDGALVPFRFNQAQKNLDAILNKQLAETGMVRAIALKGRQMGFSTYTEGRFYHRNTFGTGLRASILTHDQKATNNLFGMARRFHKNMPGVLRRDTDRDSAKELVFPDNDCSYMVATAGTKDVGRSETIQLFHGSEVAFWPNAEDHIAGITQAVAKAPGTEVILESTANGIGNVFHRKYMAAMSGDDEFIAVFVPWFWDDGYRQTPGDDWHPVGAWEEYGSVNSLERDQLFWAYLKNAEMAAATGDTLEEPCWKFKQEYPSNALEAFQSSGDSFIKGIYIARARVADLTGIGPLIIGIDPAGGGGDKTAFIDRSGRVAGSKVSETMDTDDLMRVVGRAVELIRQLRPDAVNIDVGGLGKGVYDRLAELGYADICNAVNFGSKPMSRGPTGDKLYENRRAEMWDLMRDWLQDETGAQIPDDDELHRDLSGPIWDDGATRYKSNNELIIEPKDKIRQRIGCSPDMGDALALTFAVPYNDTAFYYDEPARTGRSEMTGY